MVNKIRWGIISTAKIGCNHVIPAIKKSKDCELVAIGSRSLKKGQQVAKALGIPKAYGSYEELFKDPNIDAVYNPLPNHLHISVSLQAAKAGKHILCEKPVAISEKEAKKLNAIPKNIKFMEAFMIRFHLQWLAVLKQIKEKKLGQVKAVQVFFSYFNNDEKNIRNVVDFGGGGMYDIGCYPIVIGKYVFGTNPSRVVGLVDIDPKFKTDRLFSAILDFDKGRHMTFSVSTQLVPYQCVQILGTQGRLEVQIPFNPTANKPTYLLLDDGSNLDGSKIKKITIPACDHYQLECEAFNKAIRGKSKLEYSVDDAIANMKIIDAVFKSTKTGKWQPVG